MFRIYRINTLLEIIRNESSAFLTKNRGKLDSSTPPLSFLCFESTTFPVGHMCEIIFHIFAES